MNKTLEQAFREASKLTEEQQARLGEWILDELSERRWDAQFASSQEKLAKLAEEAWGDYRAGRTDPLDPDKI